MKKRPKRKPIQREQDRATITRMVLQGHTQQAIANFLELDRSVIVRELRAIRVEWKTSSLRDFDEARGKKLAELELLKTELWAAWELSKQQKESTLKERIASVGEGADARLKVATRQQSATGDVSYLSGVVNCIKEQSKLLGLYPEEGTGTGQSITLSDGQLGVLGQLMGEGNNVSND